MAEDPRVPPLRPEDVEDETRELLESLGGLNIFATLAHHPKLLKRWLVFGSHVLYKTTLPERERELVILRTGYRCGSEYEFGQHTVIGRQAGLTDDEIARLAADAVEGWSARDEVLVRAVDELVADHVLGDASWAALGDSWDTQQVIDLVFTVGQYVLVSMALRSLGVQRDEGVPGWPS